VVSKRRKRGRHGDQGESRQVDASKWQEYREEHMAGASRGMRELMRDKVESTKGSSFRGVGMKKWVARKLGGQAGGVMKGNMDNNLKQKVREKEDVTGKRRERG